MSAAQTLRQRFRVALLLVPALLIGILATRGEDVLAHYYTSNGFTTMASVDSLNLRQGESTTVRVDVGSERRRAVLIDVEIYNSTSRFSQQYWDSQVFNASTWKKYSVNVTLPANAAIGTYTVKIGVFEAGWKQFLHWNDSAIQFNVARSSSSIPPVTTVPATTVPGTTAPATTAPAPATTAPATTSPVTTFPATTAPATTVPSVPVSGVFTDNFNDLSKWSQLANWFTMDQAGKNPNSTATSTNGMLRIVAADQNYGDASVRSNTRYALQSGTTVIKLDVDLGAGAQPFTGFPLGYPFVTLTTLPYGTATMFSDNGKGPTPENGVMIQFRNNCRVQWGPPTVLAFANHAESAPIGAACDNSPAYQFGKLNRVELRYANGTLSIWASDFSNDGATFGPLKHIEDYSVSLPATGYVNLGVHNHASMKYADPVNTVPSVNALFDNVSYPAAGTARSYRDGAGVDTTGATNAYVVFSAYAMAASNPTITVNGHAHPFTPTGSVSKSYAESVQIPVTDLTSGNNNIAITGFDKTANVDLVITGGGAPALLVSPSAPVTSPTTAPATSAPPTTTPATTLPPTSAPPITTPPPTTTAPTVSSGGFFENFATEAGKGRFDYQLHTSMNGGLPTAIASSFMGEHDDSCNSPTTYRAISGGQVAPTFIDVSNSQLIWYCAPGNDPAKGHMMTALDTTDIASLSFSPKQTFNNVTKVCWKQNMNDLGEAKWVNVFVVPAADVTRHGGNLNYAAATGLAFGGFTQLLPAGAYDFTWLRGTTLVNGAEMMWASNAHGIATSSPPRFQICIQDSGRTLVIQRPDGTTDTINTGQTFPTGSVKVILQDASYNPTKHNGTADHLTWHWDDITVDAG